MKVYGLFYGGSNYSLPEIPRDVEEFDSLADAKETFWRRADYDREFPCVESPEMHVFVAFPDDRDPYPDRILTIGPRGGVRVERC